MIGIAFGGPADGEVWEYDWNLASGTVVVCFREHPCTCPEYWFTEDALRGFIFIFIGYDRT